MDFPEYVCPKLRCRSVNIRRLPGQHLCKCNTCGYVGEPGEFEHPLANINQKLRFLKYNWGSKLGDTGSNY